MKHDAIIKQATALINLATWKMLLGAIVLYSAMANAMVFELKPNIEAFPARDIIVSPNGTGGVELRFSTLTWNSGDGPIELIAGETGSENRQNIYQRVHLEDGSFYDRLAGTFVWHPSHAHFHFDDYAIYTLQPVDAPGGSARSSSKTTFCIMDTDLINRRLPNAPKRAVFDQCGNVIQGMSVGWGDEYGWHLPGQEIDLTGLPDGDYSLTIEADPLNRLVETNDADNTSCVLLRISVTNMTVDVLNDGSCDTTPGGGDVTVTGISPDVMSRGSVTAVTITGSGFEPGMVPVFENGSGPSPRVSGVVVHDSSTITATVTSKSGGPQRSSVWDVRVGTGVLVGGFTVLP